MLSKEIPALFWCFSLQCQVVGNFVLSDSESLLKWDTVWILYIYIKFYDYVYSLDAVVWPSWFAASVD